MGMSDEGKSISLLEVLETVYPCSMEAKNR